MNPSNPGGVVSNASAASSRQQAMIGALLRSYLSGNGGGMQHTAGNPILPMLLQLHEMFTAQRAPQKQPYDIAGDTHNANGNLNLGPQLEVPHYGAPPQPNVPPSLAALLAARSNSNGPFRL